MNHPLPQVVLTKLAGTLGFEPRISILETDGLPVSLHPWIIFNCQLAIGNGLAAQPHMQNQIRYAKK